MDDRITPSCGRTKRGRDDKSAAAWTRRARSARSTTARRQVADPKRDKSFDEVASRRVQRWRPPAGRVASGAPNMRDRIHAPAPILRSRRERHPSGATDFVQRLTRDREGSVWRRFARQVMIRCRLLQTITTKSASSRSCSKAARSSFESTEQSLISRRGSNRRAQGVKIFCVCVSVCDVMLKRVLKALKA